MTPTVSKTTASHTIIALDFIESLRSTQHALCNRTLLLLFALAYENFRQESFTSKYLRSLEIKAGRALFDTQRGLYIDRVQTKNSTYYAGFVFLFN